MRDIVLTLVILGLVPVILARPWIGALVWSWIGLMNPHRLTWGFAFSMPFAMIVALATFAGMLFSKERIRVPWSAPVVVLVMLIAWISVTTYFAIDVPNARTQWEKVMKIQIMTFVTLILITNRERLFALVAVAALSLAFYGFKGGIFTILGGGVNHVLGPEGSFIEGNTEIGLAMIMALPLMRILQLGLERQGLRILLTVTMLLTGLAILGTQSRGAFLGAAAMGVMLLIKSRKKALVFITMIAVIPAFLLVMPQSWYDRMESITNYTEDGSAMGRIYAWELATNMAIKRPLGGGFASFTPENYLIYLPDRPQAVSEKGTAADSHSIYFQMLGHHGFLGLALFLALLGTMWTTAQSVMRRTRARDDLKWAYDTASMAQVSLVGYMVAGAFLGLANFDLLYTLMAIIAITHTLVTSSLASPDAVVTSRRASREQLEPARR